MKGRRHKGSFLGLQVDQKDCKEESGKVAGVWAVDELNARWRVWPSSHHCDSRGTGDLGTGVINA